MHMPRLFFFGTGIARVESTLLFPRNDLILKPADEVLAIVHALQAASLAALPGGPAPQIMKT
jgi:hypothetical protein